MAGASKLAAESADKLDSVNSLVFILNAIGSIIFVIFGLFNDQFLFAAVGVALFLGALLTSRAIGAFADQIRLKIEILEELKKKD